MDLIAKNSGGYQVVGRPQALAAWQPPDQVRPTRVEVWWRYAGEVAAAARRIGSFAPGQVVQVPLNPGTDRDLIFSTISHSTDGLRSARELAEAHDQTVSFARDPQAAGGDLTGFYPDPTIKPDAVTYAKMQNVSAASRLLGRGSAGGPGDPEEILLGAGLTMTGTSLSAAAGGGAAGGDLSGTYPNPTIAADAVTYAKLQNVTAASRLLGRGAAGGPGDAEEITLGGGLSLSGTVLSTSGAPAVRLQHTLDQVVTPSGSGLTLSWDTESYDTDTMHDSALATRITIKTAGKYLVTAAIMFQGPNVTGERQLHIQKAGASIAIMLGLVTAGGAFIQGTTVVSLAVSDILTVIAYQTSGSNIAVNGTISGGSSGQAAPVFTATRLT